MGTLWVRARKSPWIETKYNLERDGAERQGS